MHNQCGIWCEHWRQVLTYQCQQRTLHRRKTRLESVLHNVSVCVSHQSLLSIIIPKSRCSATCSTFTPCSNRSSDKGNSWCFCLVAIVTEWVFFGLMTIELLSHQHETWSKLSCKLYCIISFPDAPKGAGDVWCHPPVWNLRAVIWFPFPISSLVFSA